jgi:two-component system OmpR family sensor kinase
VTRSFRFLLAARLAVTAVLGLAVLSGVTLMSLKIVLDREIDASMLSVASIQAASLADGPSGEMRFHEWELTPDEAASVRDLVQYAQVWDGSGASLLRSRYMTSDLPVDAESLERALAGDIVWARQDFEGAAVRTVFYPLERLGPAHEAHVLQVAAPLVWRDGMLRRTGVFLALLTLTLGAAGFGGAWWLAGRTVRPIHEIIDQAEEVGARSLDRRIQAYADTTEYRRLVNVLNTMLGRLQAGFEAQRRFTADASHELRSPLTAMRGEIEVALRRERTPQEYREVLNSTLEEVVRLSKTSDELLTLARSDARTLVPAPQLVDASELVGRVVERLRATADARGVELVTTTRSSVHATVDTEILGRITWNLVDNAVRLARSRVDVRVEPESEDLVLTVLDDGSGLGNADPESLFERFYRADEARTPDGLNGGTGLGLAIVRALAEAHGGTAIAEQHPDGGALFTVRLRQSLSTQGGP